MSNSRSRVETARRAVRWISASALFALAPKCLVCLAAYAGLGAALGAKLGRAEICDPSAGPPSPLGLWLTLLGAAAGLIAFLRSAPRCAPSHPAEPHSS